MSAFPGRASAQPNDAAVQALIDEGVALREQGQDAAALDRFERAYAISRAPRALAQIALAEQALGRWLYAEDHLAQALAHPDPWVQERRALLEQGLSRIRQQIGSVELTGGPSGAEVLIDGSAHARLPLHAPIRLEAGTVSLEVRAPGYVPFRRTIGVTGGVLARVQVTMAPEATPAPATPEPTPPVQPSPSPSPEPQPAVRPPTAEPAPPTAEPPAAGPQRDGTFLIGTGVGYGVGALGVVLFGALGGAALGDYQSVEAGCGATTSCSDADVQSIRDLSAGADATLTIGLLALATGSVFLVLWLLSGDEGEETALQLSPRGIGARF